MIAANFAPSARRDSEPGRFDECCGLISLQRTPRQGPDPRRWPRVGEKQRGNRRNGPARAVPARKDREHLVSAVAKVETRARLGRAASFDATS